MSVYVLQTYTTCCMLNHSKNKIGDMALKKNEAMIMNKTAAG